MTNSVEVVGGTYADLVYIARRLRDADAEEIFPLIWNPTPENLAAMTIANGALVSVALSGAAPVSAFGARLVRPLIWSAFMWATDRWPEVALSVTRSIRKVLMPTLIEAGAVRLDCWSIDSHKEAHRWLNLLGAVREATVEDYGQNRATYHCYSWTRSRLERSNVPFFKPVTAGDPAAAAGAAAAADPRRSRGQRRGRGDAPAPARRQGAR